MAGTHVETHDGGRRLVLLAALLAAFVVVGGLGLYRYARGFWLYRGFPPPEDPAFVSTKGTADRLYVASPALGGRRQPVDVYLPPGYDATSPRRYPAPWAAHQHNSGLDVGRCMLSVQRFLWPLNTQHIDD